MLKEYNVSPPFLKLGKLPSFLCLLSRTELIHSLNKLPFEHLPCLLYTSDAADDMQCVDLGGRRIIKKKMVDVT